MRIRYSQTKQNSYVNSYPTIGVKLCRCNRIRQNWNKSDIHEQVLKYISPDDCLEATECCVEYANNRSDGYGNVEIEVGDLVECEGRGVDDNAAVQNRVESVDNRQQTTNPDIETHLEVLIGRSHSQIVKQRKQREWNQQTTELKLNQGDVLLLVYLSNSRTMIMKQL